MHSKGGKVRFYNLPGFHYYGFKFFKGPFPLSSPGPVLIHGPNVCCIFMFLCFEVGCLNFLFQNENSPEYTLSSSGGILSSCCGCNPGYQNGLDVSVQTIIGGLVILAPFLGVVIHFGWVVGIFTAVCYLTFRQKRVHWINANFPSTLSRGLHFSEIQNL